MMFTASLRPTCPPLPRVSILLRNSGWILILFYRRGRNSSPWDPSLMTLVGPVYREGLAMSQACGVALKGMRGWGGVSRDHELVLLGTDFFALAEKLANYMHSCMQKCIYLLVYLFICTHMHSRSYLSVLPSIFMSASLYFFISTCVFHTSTMMATRPKNHTNRPL